MAKKKQAAGEESPAGPGRYEYSEGASNKFWEIAQDDAEVTTRWGRIGTEGQTKTKTFDSEGQARAQLAKQVAAKVKRGYWRVPEAPAEAEAEAEPPLPAAPLRVAVGVDDMHDPSRPILELLEETCARDDAAQIHTLDVGPWRDCYYSEAGAPEIVDALVANAGRLPGLRHLILGHSDYSSRWSAACNVVPLLEGFPRLERLEVMDRGDALALSGARHDVLCSLEIVSPGVRRSLVRDLLAAQFPALESLWLWLGHEGHFDGTVEDLLPLLSGKVFPGLRKLSLGNSALADEIATAIAGSPLLAQLDALDLSCGTLGDAGAEALLAAPATRGLKKLDLSSSWLSDEMVARLQALEGVQVVVVGNNGDRDDRYVTCWE